MLNIMTKKVYPEKSELLYAADFTPKVLEKDFEIASGAWTADKEGWLTGEFRQDGGGLIYSHRHFCGDVLMDFYAATVPPCANDLNFTFCAKGWDYGKNDADVSYIAGLQGWWTGKTGIEKYPDLTRQAMTCFKEFLPGKIYHIQAGRVGEYCFIYADDRLLVEMKDSKPIVEYGRVGFGVYAGKARYRELKVYKPYSEDFYTSYAEIFKNPEIIAK